MKRDGQPACDVGGFRQIATEFQVEAAKGDVGQALGRVRGIEEIRIKHRVVAHALKADAQGIERVKCGFIIVNGLGDGRIC